jgi:hypothetical protein
MKINSDLCFGDGRWIIEGSSMFNFCYDKCENNTGARHYWSDTDKDGKVVSQSKSDASNKKLQCNLGFSQTVNSHKALINSQLQGSRICPSLRKLFKKENE